MKKLRATILALVLAITTIFVGVSVGPVSTASAWTASCQYTPGPWSPTYGGAYCYTNRIGGAFHRVVITCKYKLFGINHTYNVVGAWTYDYAWSWANCGHHVQDLGGGYIGPGNDWVIHLNAGFSPTDQYQGGGSSGSW